MIGDYFKLALVNIKHKGVRSLLTMTGIFIGIAAVVSLISLGDGMQNAINEQFELLGTNLVYVMPGGSMMSMGGGSAKLSQQDVDLIRKIRGVELAAGMTSKIAKVKYDGQVKYTQVSGLDKDKMTHDLLFEGTGIKIEKGQKWFKPADTYKAVVGYGIGNGDFFKKPVGVGDKIYINDRKFDVAATVSKIGNPQDDSSIYIPLDVAKDIFGIGDDFIVVMARVNAGYEPSEVADDIKKTLRKDHGLDEGDEDFTVMTMDQIMDSAGIVLDATKWFLVAIAGISLFVGGVGIMNTMYTAVLERTREIGVMKAVGAKNEDITLLFMIESGTFGLVGGAIGCLIGAGLSKAVELAAVASGIDLLEAHITPALIIGALSFSFLVGCFSGFFPAKQAEKLNPVDSLRYE